jgi:dihydrolipoamide dehydrogenase
MKEYDVIIIGGGPGGYVGAIKAAQLGAKVALIEKSEIGGVCLNEGCIPTKALLKSAQVYKTILNADYYGVSIAEQSGITVNFKRMQERKDEVVQRLAMGVKTLLKKNGVKTYQGFGKVINNHQVEVNGELLNTKYLILATGSSTLIPPIKGLKEGIEQGYVLTSKELLNIQEIPRQLVIVGGGVIGVEFATLFASLGTHVTLIEKAGEILVQVDDEIRSAMVKLLTKDGIEIKTNAEVTEFKKDGCEAIVNGQKQFFKTDTMLVSMGRKANLQGLESLNLKLEKGHIGTNEQLETSIKGVYAIGDVNGKYMLAHVASSEGIVAVNHLMGKDDKIDYKKVPSCIYSFPEIGFVGLTEQEAKAKSMDYIVSTFPLSANGKALAEGSSEGFIKIIAEKEYGEVLGVHILAPHATDMIAEAVTTMELEGTVHELAKAIHPHPTLSEIVMEAAHGAIDKPIHLFK